MLQMSDGGFQRLERKCVQYLFPDCRRYGKIISQLTEITVISHKIAHSGLCYGNGAERLVLNATIRYEEGLNGHKIFA